MVIKIVKIKKYDIGLHFRDGEFMGLLEPGWHWLFNPLGRVRVEVVSQSRAPWLAHEKLDMIVKSGALGNRALVLDLKDYERALVWIDERFSHVLPPGLHVYWTTFRSVKAEIVDARAVRFTHPDLPVLVKSQMADRVLESVAVPAGHVGVWFRDGSFVETLPAGRHAFWKNVAEVKLVPVDTRELILDVAGQEIMTADKVTRRPQRPGDIPHRGPEACRDGDGRRTRQGAVPRNSARIASPCGAFLATWTRSWPKRTAWPRNWIRASPARVAASGWKSSR